MHRICMKNQRFCLEIRVFFSKLNIHNFQSCCDCEITNLFQWLIFFWAPWEGHYLGMPFGGIFWGIRIHLKKKFKSHIPISHPYLCRVSRWRSKPSFKGRKSSANRTHKWVWITMHVIMILRIYDLRQPPPWYWRWSSWGTPYFKLVCFDFFFSFHRQPKVSHAFRFMPELAGGIWRGCSDFS